ncbi:hypothetical protein N836_28480 [Leptolyngbya sp. Heron Island J]|uniref:hypothetical protein n=1 Tax=Leptolyngbya sp. Heron Island J TaxID=1385935 RepID=UPI0003B99408|nr:hypothetical protein [Leptolyngbya sp. Heron Island J]ESA32095.1 hypothetical protein N836_28480 [Leptolyngbya sp. Heron Island J]
MSLSIGDTDLNPFQKFICCLATASTLLILPSVMASAQSQESADCGFLVSPQEFNTFENDDRIVIGQVSGRPYIVLLTHDLEDSLSAIRACIPDAFLTSSRLGSYIHIASFNNYRDAKELTEQIDESLNIDVRIIHRSRLRQ